MTDERWLDQVGIAAALAAGDGVAILPTDTLPGLHARLDRPDALARIRRLKGRAETSPFLLLCAEANLVESLVDAMSPLARGYLPRLWPGPFTAILPAAAALPAAVVGPQRTVAVRVPRPEALRSLLGQTGPLASTSVNRTGADPASSLKAAAARFAELPVWDVSWPDTGTQASALVDLTGPVPRELRPGPLSLPAWDDLLS